MAIIRAIAFYWRKKKAADVNHVAVSFVFGREPLHGQEGVIAYSRGQAKMRLTINEVVAVTGSTSTLDIERILNQEDIDVSFILGGKFMQNEMAVLQADYDSDSEKGVTTGQIVLEGSKPKITG